VPIALAALRHRGTTGSAEHGWFLAAALTRSPQEIATDAAQSVTAVGELDLGVRHTVVVPARAPVASARHRHRLRYVTYRLEQY